MTLSGWLAINQDGGQIVWFSLRGFVRWQYIVREHMLSRGSFEEAI